MAEPMTIVELQEGFRNKTFSASEIMQDTLGRIEKHDRSIHAFLDVFKEEALHAAEMIDAAWSAGKGLGSLAGIPIAIKDNIVQEGHTATAGSKVLENFRSPYSATVVDRLRASGAIVVGRTNMDEFAMGSSTENSAYGVTKNPWNIDKVPGGSSGGSAAAVASGMVPAALGSDTGGSVRQPASLCGITGLKPTYGRVSRYGLIAMVSSFDQIGTLARSAEDSAIMLSVISGNDPKDSTSSEHAPFQWKSMSSLEGKTIGVPKEYFHEGMDEDIEKLVRDAIGECEKLGATIEEVSLPATEHTLASYYVITPAEVSSNLARFDGVRYGNRIKKDSLVETYNATRGALLGKEVQRRILIGTHVLSSGYYDAYYRKAQQVRTLVRRDFDAVFSKVDFLLTPTSPSVAWNLGEKFEDPLTMYLSDIYTVSVNIAGLPAVSVPCGLVHDLPVGLQFIGKAFDEATILGAAALYEKVHAPGTFKPKIFG